MMDLATFKSKKHLFFDLDHTLWDFDKNAEETLTELFEIYDFRKLGIASCDNFIATYTTNNHKLWAQYHIGEITKDNLRAARFVNTFKDLGIEPSLFPLQFEEDYLTLCPQKTNLFPYAIEVLEYLQKKYVLHLISNGFKNASETKVTNTGIDKYFSQIIISENIGIHKPHPEIFSYALKGALAEKNESIMIGDSIEADIRGAQNFGIDAIFFNPNNINRPKDIKYQIIELKELMEIF